MYGLSKAYFEFEPDGSPDLIERLIPFGISTNGHYFAWDPGEPTGEDEFAIYAIGSKMLAVRRAGRDLNDFLSSCVNDGVKKILGPGYAPLPRTFRPMDLQW